LPERKGVDEPLGQERKRAGVPGIRPTRFPPSLNGKKGRKGKKSVNRVDQLGIRKGEKRLVSTHEGIAEKRKKGSATGAH